MPENGRFAGLHCDLIEKHLDTKFPKNVFNEIVLSHRYSARHQKEIVLQSLSDLAAEIIQIVTSDTYNDRLTARALHLITKRVRVAVSNLTGLRFLGNLDQFIASGDDCNSRFF